MEEITKEEFIQQTIDNAVVEADPWWRKGQAVFNYVNDKYHIAREIQFLDGVDCFFDDNDIEYFLSIAYERLRDREAI